MRSALRDIFTKKGRAAVAAEKERRRKRVKVLIEYWHHEITAEECNRRLKALDPPEWSA